MVSFTGCICGENFVLRLWWFLKWFPKILLTLFVCRGHCSCYMYLMLRRGVLACIWCDILSNFPYTCLTKTLTKTKLWFCLSLRCVFASSRHCLCFSLSFLCHLRLAIALTCRAVLSMFQLYRISFSFPFPAFLLYTEHAKNFYTYRCCWLMLQALLHLQTARYVLLEHTGPAQVLLKTRFVPAAFCSYPIISLECFD